MAAACWKNLIPGPSSGTLARGPSTLAAAAMLAAEMGASAHRDLGVACRVALLTHLHSSSNAQQQYSRGSSRGSHALLGSKHNQWDVRKRPATLNPAS